MYQGYVLAGHSKDGKKRSTCHDTSYMSWSHDRDRVRVTPRLSAFELSFLLSLPVMHNSHMLFHSVRSDMLPRHKLRLENYGTNTQMIQENSSVGQKMLIL